MVVVYFVLCTSMCIHCIICYMNSGRMSHIANVEIVHFLWRNSHQVVKNVWRLCEESTIKLMSLGWDCKLSYIITHHRILYCSFINDSLGFQNFKKSGRVSWSSQKRINSYQIPHLINATESVSSSASASFAVNDRSAREFQNSV